MEAVGICPSSLFKEVKILTSTRGSRIVYRAVVEVAYPKASINILGHGSSYTVHVSEKGFEKRLCEVASFEFRVAGEIAEVIHAILYAENLPLDDLECILRLILKHLHERWKPRKVRITPSTLLLNLPEGQLALLLRNVGGFHG